GSSAVAGYTIGIRIVLFALLPSVGLANAAATLVGQNLGAKRPDRAAHSAWLAGGFNAAFLGVIGLLLLAAAPAMIRIFDPEPAVAGYAVSSLRVISLGFAFYGLGMVMSQALNGAGDTRTPTLINFGCFWVLELPLAWGLSHGLGLGPLGAFIAILVAFCTVAVAGALAFRAGGWKQRFI
ncbi:MAG TPA: MATE family efflux transporter, partial [Myxococcaceae bacterium]|nr:MATE family efflux transporter [Myxococcaceae bacterium]